MSWLLRFAFLWWLVLLSMLHIFIGHLYFCCWLGFFFFLRNGIGEYIEIGIQNEFQQNNKVRAMLAFACYEGLCLLFCPRGENWVNHFMEPGMEIAGSSQYVLDLHSKGFLLMMIRRHNVYPKHWAASQQGRGEVAKPRPLIFAKSHPPGFWEESCFIT